MRRQLGQFARQAATRCLSLPASEQIVDQTRAQADNFINTVSATGDAGELPPAVDVEEVDAGISAAEAAASLQFFLSIVEQGFGKRPVIYT